MDVWLWPLVGVLLVGALPGVLAARLLLPETSWSLAVALAPTLSCGLLFLYFQALAIVGLGVAPWTFALLIGLEGLLVVRAFRKGSLSWRIPRPSVHPGLVLLGLAIIVGTAVWVRAVPPGHVPPNHDSIQHGLIAARIAATGSLDPARVIVTSVGSDQAMVPFYPVSLHIIAALTHRITGAGLPEAFWVVVVVGGAALFPLGMYLLTRLLFADRLMAGFAALLSVLLPLFPYKPIAWGGMPLIVGMAVLPAVAVGVVEVLRRYWSVKGLVIALLALIGVMMIHTSEVPTALLLIAIVLFDGIRGQHMIKQYRSALARLATVVVLLMLMAVPIAGRATEGREVADNQTVSLITSLRPVFHLQVAISVGQFRMALLALAGAALLLRRRPWMVLGLAVILGLYVIDAVSTNSTLRLLTAPWYRQAERVAYNVAYFVPVFAAFAVIVAARRGALVLPPRWRKPALAVSVVLAGAWVAGSVPTRTSQLLRKEINAYSTIGPKESDSFRFIARSGGRNFEVLGDEYGDGSPWMYAISGARPVFAIKPSQVSAYYPSWKERLFLLNHLTDAKHAAEVDELMAKYCVGFVYYGERRFYGALRLLDLAALKTDQRFEEAFRSGDTRIFRVKNARCDAAGTVRASVAERHDVNRRSAAAAQAAAGAAGPVP